MNARKTKTTNVHYTSSPCSNQQIIGGEQPISSWMKPAGIQSCFLMSVPSPQERFQGTTLLPDQHGSRAECLLAISPHRFFQALPLGQSQKIHALASPSAY